MNFIWNIIQQHKIEKVGRQVDQIEEGNRELKYNTEDYALNVRQLALTTQAVWSFLKEKHNLDDQDLLHRIEEIDLSDGYLDGRITAQVVTCPSCSKKLNSRNKRCIYCEAINPEFNPFAE